VTAVLIVASSLASCPARPAEDEARMQEAPSREFRVAVDIGHGARYAGALSARGVPEHVFNEQLAGTVMRTLQRGGFTAFTIREDSSVAYADQLRGRSRLAAEGGASLLLSVHHDSVQSRYLSEWSFEGETRRFSDAFSGYSIFCSSESGAAEDSFRFARMLADALRSRGLHPSLHHAEDIPGERRKLVDRERGIFDDPLLILQSASMPAVLLEAGVIVNRTEEEQLSTEARRRLIADAVLDAVQRFTVAPSSPVP
jgi:N-acetylmuramoyl-L-alanine amidase